MVQFFGTLPDGSQTHLYTISRDGITAKITDLGATLVNLWVPDKEGVCADVVLGYDDAQGYLRGNNFLGATVGRNANRIKAGCFLLNGTAVTMDKNNGSNNLHSGKAYFKDRLWKVESHTRDSVRLSLYSPHGDQGFPGNAQIHVTYALEPDRRLAIRYDGISDRDTVFNLTNHSYFNLAGHDRPELGGKQILTMPARHYVEVDSQLIPTGKLPSVDGTVMDFRKGKTLCQGMEESGYDHTFEVFTVPGAILTDPVSGRTMAVTTDCPGVQLYSSYGLSVSGKNGVHYGSGSGICLETQYYPDSVNRPEWKQPIVKAGQRYHSETVLQFRA